MSVYNAVSILAGAERKLGPDATGRVFEEETDRAALTEHCRTSSKRSGATGSAATAAAASSGRLRAAAVRRRVRDLCLRCSVAGL